MDYGHFMKVYIYIHHFHLRIIKGCIIKPNEKIYNIFYLPQIPYLFFGTLKEQIIYPYANDKNIIDDDYIHLLNIVGLSYLWNQYGGNIEMNWSAILSPGEQQLISFARLFYHKPKFAVLDEATSSLHEEVENSLYKICEELEITFISVGHRNTLKKFHQFLLQLDFHHNWTLMKL